METFERYEPQTQGPQEVQAILEGFERTRILDVYFARLDGRIPDRIEASVAPLFTLSMDEIRDYLMARSPGDKLFHYLLTAKF